MTTHRSIRVSRSLIIVGVAAVIVGTIDPLEGSIAILAGFALIAAAAYLRHSRHRIGLYWAVPLVAIGVGMMFLFSSFGGIGGSTGRSMWWALTMLPYPIGWMLGVVQSIRLLRDPVTPAEITVRS